MTMTDRHPEPRTEGSADSRGQGFETANDRFKKSFGAWLWGSILAATAIHFTVLAFFPALSVEDMSFTVEEFEVVEVPPEIELPPPPEEIQRPAEPVIADIDVDPEVTIEPTTFEHFDPELPPPPSAEGLVDLASQPTFTPYEVAPEMLNRGEVSDVLEAEYPRTYRDVGIGGSVVVHFFINEEGAVQNALVARSSGFASFDEAALRVAEVARFSPAFNRSQAVPVWIQIPITFVPRG